MVLKFEDFVNESKKKADKEEPAEKKSTVSKEDEEKYLSPKQRKLPDGLKKGIIAKMKKSGGKKED